MFGANLLKVQCVLKHALKHLGFLQDKNSKQLDLTGSPTATNSTKEIGQAAELQAKQFLLSQGLSLVTQNYRSKHGEIDLIMQHENCWVFIEVRYRASRQFGGGLESVDHRKQTKLINTAQHYMQQHIREDEQCRFDVIAMSGDLKQVKIDWIVDAFN